MEEKNNNEMLKVFAIIIIILGIVFFIALFTSSLQKNIYIENSSAQVSTKENPFEISNKYDGTYSFKMESKTMSGHAYLSVGIITLENGQCKARYTVLSENTVYESNNKFDGFCGLNNSDEAKYYLSFNNENYVYKCEQKDNGLLCELKSKYDLSGYTNNTSLNLELLNNSENKDVYYNKLVTSEKAIWEQEIQRKKEEEEKSKKEAEEKSFKESCQTYTYEQLARNPENIKGKNIKLTGEVIQALYGSGTVDLRVDITKNGTYTTYYTDTIYVVYDTKIGEDKILEDDIITIYGTSMGDYTYTSAIGSKVTLPLIYAKYIVLDK